MAHMEYNNLSMKRSCHPSCFPLNVQMLPSLYVHLLTVLPPFFRVSLPTFSTWQVPPPPGSLPRLSTQGFGYAGPFSVA